MVKNFTENLTDASQQLGTTIYLAIEQLTETIGSAIAPLAENSIIQTMAKIPGFDWLLTGIGQVDTTQVEADVAQLREEFPTDSREAIAHHIINRTILQAGQVGLLTNIIPPIALALMAVDLAAIAKLQAEMVYRIAAVYGFDSTAPTRRGEVIAIYGLSFGTSTPIKAGLSVVELIPGLGAIVGAASNAKLIHLVGMVALAFYETKAQRPSAS